MTVICLYIIVYHIIEIKGLDWKIETCLIKGHNYFLSTTKTIYYILKNREIRNV